MRVILLGVCVLFAGCGIFKPADVSDIREIRWGSGGVQSNGKGSDREVTFRSDGTAERSDETFEHDFPKTGVVSHNFRASVTPEQFRQLAQTIVGRGFFSKQSHSVNDAWESITIVNSKGETHLSTIVKDDADIKAMVQAVGQLEDQLKWDAVQPSGTPQP